MLAFLKQALHAVFAPLVAPALYIGAAATVAVSAIKRAEVALFVLIFLIPQPNIWYKFHGYFLGKDLIDLLVLSVALGIYINKKGFAQTDQSRFLLLFIVLNYVALWNTSMRFGLPAPISRDNVLLADWKNYAEMIFLYFLAANAFLDEKMQKRAIILMAFTILFIAVREFRNFTVSDAFSYDKRDEGPFWVMGLGANHLGAFVAQYGGMLLGLYLFDDDKRRKMLYLAGSLFCLYPLFFSYSRGAYLAAFCVLAFYGVTKKRSFLVVVAALLIAWQTILPETVVQRIAMTETQNGQLESSAEERIELWHQAWDAFENNPIFGVGFEGFAYTLPKNQKLTDTHNFYMRMLSEEGVVGLFFFVLLLARAFRSGFILFRTADTPFYRGLGFGFMGAIVACSVSNLFGDRWSYTVLGAYLFLLWGVIDRRIVFIRERATETVAVADNVTQKAISSA